MTKMTRFLYYPVKQPGLIVIEGEDRVSFLQRQTTNDVRLLQPGTSLLNILTNPEGRILDVFGMWHNHERIFLAGLPGRHTQTFTHFTSHKFFMDKIQLHDISQDFVRFELFGDIHDLPWQEPVGQTMPDIGECRTITVGSAEVMIIRPAPPLGPGAWLIAPASHENEIEQFFKQNGGQNLTPETYETLRIEAGTPGKDGELVADYTPLENGLDKAVSTQKGCFTGQEVLARQVNYKKITKRLLGVRLQSTALPGTKLYVNGRVTGAITSVTISPRHGPIGLAFIRRPNDQAGKILDFHVNRDETSHGEVVDLPFLS